MREYFDNPQLRDAHGGDDGNGLGLRFGHCNHETMIPQVVKFRTADSQRHDIILSMDSRNVNYANQLRRSLTHAEERLYSELLVAFKNSSIIVACQEPISYYIADFMLYPQRIAIECDGGYHLTPKAQAYDRRRTTAMNQLGIRVLRFTNRRVLYETTAVIQEILAACGPLEPKSDGGPHVTICPPHRANASGRKAKRKWSELLFYRLR